MIIVKPAVVKPEAAAKAPPYKVPAKPVSADYLSGPGCLRVQHLMYLYDRSHSAINRKIREGHIPAPTGFDPRPYWSNHVIREHLKIATGEKRAAD